MSLRRATTGLGCEGEDLEYIIGNLKCSFGRGVVAECGCQADGRGSFDDGDFIR
jgi:hypothetical protein